LLIGRCRTNLTSKKLFENLAITSARFNNAFESKLPELLERFDDQEIKFVSELFYASLKDSTLDKRPVVSRQARLLKLAERFSEIKFESKQNRQLSLILLGDLSTSVFVTNKELAKELAKEVEGVGLKQLLVYNYKDMDLQTKLYGNYLATQIQLKNFEPVKRTWKPLVA